MSVIQKPKRSFRVDLPFAICLNVNGYLVQNERGCKCFNAHFSNISKVYVVDRFSSYCFEINDPVHTKGTIR